MHWTVRGPNAIITLRCSKLSGRFEDFWERRPEGRVTLSHFHVAHPLSPAT